MPWQGSIFLWRKSMVRPRPDMSIWAGMGMDRSTIAGYGKRVAGNEAAFEGWKNGNSIKKLLEPCFKIERDILSAKDP